MPCSLSLQLSAADWVPTAAQLQAVVSGWLDGPGEHHDPHKPFTVSRSARRNDIVRIEVNLVDEQLADRLVQRTLEDRGQVRVGPALTELVPWEDGSFLRLDRVQSWTELLDAARPLRYYPFEFLTPTAFRQGHVVNPLPDPVRIFGHLRRRWEAFAPDHLQPSIDLRGCGLTVTRLAGKTEIARALERRWPGFVGTVTIHASTHNERDWRVLDALARLAPYVGVGTNTTFGMGRTVYRPER